MKPTDFKFVGFFILIGFIVQWIGQIATNDQMGVRIPLESQYRGLSIVGTAAVC